MEWTTVESSQIAEVGFDPASQPTYDPGNGTLGIRFKATGRSAASEYHYGNVPPRVHRALMNADSVGSYFTAEIKKHPELYPFERQGEVLPPATEGDSALAKVDKMTPEQIFVPGTMDSILAAIREEVTKQAVSLDISTEANRKALAALAFKVTKSKTFIENQRKSLVAGEKKRLQTIDAEGRRIWDILEGIAAEVRKPLTDWEQVDKDRILRHERTLERLLDLARVQFGISIEGITSLIVEAEAIDPAKMEEFAQLATSHKDNALKELNLALTTAAETVRQKAENEQLRAEAAERATQERAISAAKIAREQAEQIAENARQILTRENQAAEERAKVAEAKAAQAVEEERQRAAAVLETERQEALARENDEAHREGTKIAAVVDLMEIDDMTEELAAAVVDAIAAGKISHVTISY